VAADKRQAADLGAWLIFEDETGQTLKLPKGRTWARRGRTPIARVTARGTHKVSIVGLVCLKPRQRPRLVYRTLIYRGRKHERKGFTEDDYIAVLDAAHRQLGGPIVLIWDRLGTHTSTRMRELVTDRPWLRTHLLPAYAPELNAVEGVWALLKKYLADLAKHNIEQITATSRSHLKQLQYRPDLIMNLATKTGLDLWPP
jgi:DDE superfamily endonuclease